MEVSYGILKEFNNFEIKVSCSSNIGLGSPILNFKTNKLIGIIPRPSNPYFINDDGNYSASCSGINFKYILDEYIRQYNENFIDNSKNNEKGIDNEVKMKKWINN